MRSRKAASGPKRVKARGTRRDDLLGRRIGAKAISSPSRIQEIGLGGINVAPDRMRKLRPEVVDALGRNRPATRGQLQTDHRAATGRRWLLGGHRAPSLACLPQAQAPDDPCRGARPRRGGGRALLVEIDENLIRADLTPAERALHIGKRKELYEQLHPRPNTAPSAEGKESSGWELFRRPDLDTSGKARATVARDATRAKAIAVLADIVGTSLDQGNEIDALAKLVRRSNASWRSAPRPVSGSGQKPRSSRSYVPSARRGSR